MRDRSRGHFYGHRSGLYASRSHATVSPRRLSIRAETKTGLFLSRKRNDSEMILDTRSEAVIRPRVKKNHSYRLIVSNKFLCIVKFLYYSN